MIKELAVIKYENYMVYIQKLKSGTTVINLTPYTLVINDQMVSPQPDANLIHMVTYVDCEETDIIENIPINKNSFKYGWIDFFYNGITDLADYIIVDMEVLHLVSFVDLDIKHCHKIISPIKDDSVRSSDTFTVRSNNTFIVGKFQTWYDITEENNDDND